MKLRQILMVNMFAFMPVVHSDAAERLPRTIENMLTPMLGTLAVVANPHFAEGRLTSCQLVFDAIFQDFVYQQGEFSKLFGHVGFTRINDTIAGSLKVGKLKFEWDETGVILTPLAPMRAYLLSPNYNSTLEGTVASNISDTLGAVLVVVEAQTLLNVLTEALSTNKLTLAFNEADGASDNRVTLDLDVAATSDTGVRSRSVEAQEDFIECLSNLLE